MKRSEFLAAVPVALYALACGEETPSTTPATGGTSAATGGSAPQGGSASGASGGPVGGSAGTSTGGSGATSGTGGSGGSATGGTSPSSGGSTSTPSWHFDCHDAALPLNTGALARAADFSPNSETGAVEPHVLYCDGNFLIRRTKQYVTAGEVDHTHEVLLTDEQIDQLIAGGTIVVETNGPPMNASAGHGHTITIRSCFGA